MRARNARDRVRQKMRNCQEVDRGASAIHDPYAVKIRGNAGKIVHTSQRLLRTMDGAGQELLPDAKRLLVSSLDIGFVTAFAVSAIARSMHAVSAQRACKAGANDLDCASVDGFLPGGVGISVEKLLCGA